jgi:DNA repair protein RadC
MSIIDTRVIPQYAIKANAPAVILAHNHPSGNVKEALKLVDIELLDHLILTYEEKYSTIETDGLGSG